MKLYQEMKLKVPRIFNLVTKWRGAAGFTLWSLYRETNISLYPSDEVAKKKSYANGKFKKRFYLI
jgi:hypothetical protein